MPRSSELRSGPGADQTASGRRSNAVSVTRTYAEGPVQHHSAGRLFTKSPAAHVVTLVTVQTEGLACRSETVAEVCRPAPPGLLQRDVWERAGRSFCCTQNSRRPLYLVENRRTALSGPLGALHRKSWRTAPVSNKPCDSLLVVTAIIAYFSSSSPHRLPELTVWQAFRKNPPEIGGR